LRSKLKDKRLEKGYTQHEVATKAGIGRTYYVEIENGNRKGSLKLWLSISKALEIPEKELIDYMKQ